MAKTPVAAGASLLGAAIITLLPAAGHAAPTARDLRLVIRCQRAVESEGLAYVNAGNARLLRCVRPTRECELSGGSDTCTCRQATSGCASLAAELPGLEERLRSRVASACAGARLDLFFGTSALRTKMADSACVVDSADSLARCLLKELRTELGDLVEMLEPATCDLLQQAGVAGRLPAELCADDAVCPEPPPPPPPPPPVGGGGPLYCGGPAAVQCPDGFVCSRSDALCTLASPPGVCVKVTDPCVDDGHPVCGCDGQTYASDCARQRAGVVLARAGTCDPPMRSCGAGMPACATGFFCEFPRGDCGEGGVGTCQPMRSEPCTLCTAFLPGKVCGCDFVTYASDCARQAAGMSKFFDGDCMP